MPSSVIKEMEYDKRKRILRIVFVSGMIYDYLDVPEEVFSAMRLAQSKGTFLNQLVKPHYSFRKIKKDEMDLSHKKNHHLKS
jgi:hypothetical protein